MQNYLNEFCIRLCS